MTLSLRTAAFSILMALSLTISGCGSSAKKDSSLSDPSFAGADAAGSFEINSDSDSGTAGGLRTVFFDFNSATLSTTARQALQNNADFMKANMNVRVQVEGHADERGGVQYNLALGERRARAVRDYLISMGVEGRRIATVSFGKERPLAFGHDESAWSQNRRGNFVITAK